MFLCGHSVDVFKEKVGTEVGLFIPKHQLNFEQKKKKNTDVQTSWLTRDYYGLYWIIITGNTTYLQPQLKW